MIGRTFDHYEIVEQLGTGGMGVVYKARDTRLDRFVAIKVLRAEAIADAERKRRFVQEAKAASALNHPNIVTIHEIASADGIDYIVMEYVAGQTLDRLISSGGMRLRDLLDYGGQAADAIAKAHAAGILHRDLKPSNLMVTTDGRLKILDFGLAKLTANAPHSNETTLLADPTRTSEGHVVGTPAYMSPEQAEGKPVDARSDIFSFGALLYEMATGVRAFQGDSTASTLAAVLTSTPKPPGQTVPNLPRELERIIVRCLRKEPGRRFQVMADLAVELDEIKTESSETIETVRIHQSRRRWPWIAAVAGLVVIVAAGAWSVWPRKTPSGTATVIPLTTYRGSERLAALSPDGTEVAFVWDGSDQNNDDIYIKPVDAVSPIQLTSDAASDMSPAWSPSGRKIAFLRLQTNGGAGIYVTAPVPGSEQKIANVRLGPDSTRTSVTWTPDGEWLVVAGLGPGEGENGLFLFNVDSSAQRTIVTSPLRSVRYRAGSVSERADEVAYIGCDVAGTGGCDVWAQTIGADLAAQGTPHRLTEFRADLYGIAWMPDGRSLVTGATLSQGAFTNLWLVPTGGGTPTKLDWMGTGIREPSLSKNGHRMVATQETGGIDIWQFDTSPRGTAAHEHAVSSTLVDLDPQFSPDGSRIAFASARSGRDVEIWVANSDGTAANMITRGAAGRSRGSPQWSSDGKRIVYDSLTEDGVRRAFVIDQTGGPARRVSDYEASRPTWSHDDKWIYFSSGHSGRTEIWKVPSQGGTPEQVTHEGGSRPRFYGEKLFYRRGAAIYALKEGTEQQVLDGVGVRSDYVVFGDDVFYTVQPDPSHRRFHELQVTHLMTRKVETVGRFDATFAAGLTVSPDGKSLLVGVFDFASDLVLVENFQ